ncbi:MAG: NUDIX hydrolase [Kofleriaceae bacterium]|nr:NUDIX hydrolase [Kofleriaceae bacterium]
MSSTTPPGGYRNPVPTVDILIELDQAPGTLVFIARRNEPRGWALPGGFVDAGEDVASAAVREAKEETGLDVELHEQFHVYSDPRRDPRKHTLSVVFIARASGEPVAADDAGAVAVCRFDDLAALGGPLVFDHATIVADYLHYRRTGQRPPPRR